MAIPVPNRRSGHLLLIALCCTGIAWGAASDPPAEFTYHTNVAEVRVTFSASDQNNHGVATLQASDFAVVDKDIIVRNFQSFTRTDWTKLEIAVLVDASSSVTPQFRQEMADTLDLVSQTTGVPDENLSIFSFHGLEPALLCAGDCRTAHAVERLPGAQPGGLTPLFDAVMCASDFLARRGDARAEKVLILISDGDDTISRNSLGDALDSALKNDVEIFSVNLKRADSIRGAAVLAKLASATGGRYFPPPNNAAKILNVILEGFRATYTVSYRLPSRAGGFHSLRILPTHNLNLQFRSRSGYYYQNNTR